MTTVVLYADTHKDGALSFYPSPDAVEVLFGLAEGYRITEGFTGVRAVFGPPGTLGMTIDEAVSAGVLKPLLDEPPKRSPS
jgi:hypothetical protein